MSIYNNVFLDKLENNKSREMGTPYSGNSTLTQFNRTMKREGKTVTTYIDRTEFQAFFRIKEDNENQKETIIMYYGITAPVRPGTLVMYGHGVFLTLNRETVENDIYYKSTLVKCNGVYNDIDGRYGNIPFYCDNMKSSVSIGNNVITTLNGNIELITEESALSNQIEIDNHFNEFGRTFKVSNRYVMDGIVHIIAEVYVDMLPTMNYSIIIDGKSTINVGEKITLLATPYINGNITTEASFEWSSDDTNIVTVDSEGNLIGISEGETHISVLWKEFNIKEQCFIKVMTTSSTISNLSALISCKGSEILKAGGNAKIFSVSFTNAAGDPVNDIHYTWEATIADEFKDCIITEILPDNRCRLKVSYDTMIIGNSVKLAVKDMDGKEIGHKIIEIGGGL